MDISEIRPSEIPELATYVREHHYNSQLSSIKKINTLLSSKEPIGQIWISRFHDHLAGFLYLFHGKKGPRGAFYPKPLYTTIDTLFVLPALRRRKIATSMLEAAQGYAQSQGSPVIYADMPQTNYAAQQFFLYHRFEMIHKWKWQGEAMVRYKMIIRASK